MYWNTILLLKSNRNKVETPIRDNIRGIGNLGVQRAWSENHECVSKSEREVLGIGI
jgi:hypothetical protein